MPRDWSFIGLMLLGTWLLAISASFTNHSLVCRDNDIVCGILLIVFGAAALRRLSWGQWGACLVGVWLQLAPLIYWAPDAYLYLNDTLIGVLAIVFSVLVPGIPGESADSGPEIPPGWTYNPSSWPQRLPILFLGTFGWFIARYMAAYQLGYVDHIWDPIFGNGTLMVITSSVSKAFPVSDAGLGAAAYTLEALMAVKGGTRRWRTAPWLVLLFGILVVPLGLTSIILIILQPLLVGHWCAWCLLTALCMLLMIALTIDEVVAVLQYLRTVRISKQNFWRVFWHGGGAEGAAHDIRTPSTLATTRQIVNGMTWGITVPWNLLVTILAGVWLMAAPSLLGIVGWHANAHYIIGALTITFSVIAMAEVVRMIRYAATLLGLAMMAVGVTLIDVWVPGAIYDIATGVLIVAASLPRGHVLERYGSWSTCIR